MNYWLQEGFFDIVVRQYMLPDIQNLLFITGCEKGKCASPLGLYICKCMEFWGYLIAEDEYPSDGEATEKVMSYLALTLGDEKAISLRPAILFCNMPYALLGAGGFSVTVMERWPLFEHATLNTKSLALVFMQSTDKLRELLGDETVAVRVARRLKQLVQTVEG